mmetsp:Transcript_15012/g.51970  ORF Transcript_15012/g.51970 Transcript_15012/m.51970 type:complete len:620 (-) Transcript_15012:43-1902(-)
MLRMQRPKASTRPTCATARSLWHGPVATHSTSSANMDSAPEARRCSSRVVSALWAGAVAVAADAALVDIADDGAKSPANVLTVADARSGDARDAPDAAGRLLFVRNGDADVATLGGHSVPPGATRAFLRSRSGGWDALSTAVEAGDLKTIEGVERFRAAADLDVGDFAVRARDLAVRAGEGEAGRVVFLDDKGALRRDGDLVFEAPAGGKRGKLSVGRLEVAGAVDGPLDLGGHAIRDARLEGGAAVGLSVVAARAFTLDAAPGAATRPPEGFERFAFFGPGGGLGARPDVYVYNGTLYAPALGGAGGAALEVRGDVAFGGHELRGAAIVGGSLEGIARVSVEDVQVLPKNGSALAPAGTLALLDANGTLAPAEAGGLVARCGDFAAETAAVGALAADLDASGHVIRGAMLEGGGAAGLEFVAADVALISTLDPADASRRPLVLAGAGGSLEGEPSLHLDAEHSLDVPRKLVVRGDVDAKGDGFFGGSVVVSGTVMGSGAYIDSSDARFKTNLTAIDPELALAGLAQVPAYTYAYKNGDFPSRNFPKGRDVGFLAQDLEPIFPELVAEDAEGYKAVAYGRAAPLLAAAVGALKERNDGLEARVAALEAQVRALVAALEA